MVSEWLGFSGRWNVPLNQRRKWLTSASGNPSTKLSRLRTVSSLLESPQKKSQRPLRHSHASSCVKIWNLQCAEYTHPLLSRSPTLPSHQGSWHSSFGSMQTNLPSSRISHVLFQVKLPVDDSLVQRIRSRRWRCPPTWTRQCSSMHPRRGSWQTGARF